MAQRSRKIYISGKNLRFPMQALDFLQIVLLRPSAKLDQAIQTDPMVKQRSLGGYELAFPDGSLLSLYQKRIYLCLPTRKIGYVDKQKLPTNIDIRRLPFEENIIGQLFHYEIWRPNGSKQDQFRVFCKTCLHECSWENCPNCEANPTQAK